ncbi:hypothetical protein NKG05_30925 [Oerskovia sp. M15]
MAADAATAAAAATEEITAPIVARMTDIEVELKNRRARKIAEQDAALAGLGDGLSFGAVAQAFGVANTLRAIAGYAIVVPAGEVLDGPRLRFSWYGDHYSPDEHHDPITVEYVAERNPSAGIGIPVVAVSWSTDDEPTGVFADLIDNMIATGFGPEAKALEVAAAIGHLTAALSAAVAARRADETSWFTSTPLLELVADGWALTQDGLEVRDHGLVLRERDIAALRGKGTKGAEVPAPEGLDPRSGRWQSGEPWTRFGTDATPRACRTTSRGGRAGVGVKRG